MNSIREDAMRNFPCSHEMIHFYPIIKMTHEHRKFPRLEMLIHSPEFRMFFLSIICTTAAVQNMKITREIPCSADDGRIHLISVYLHGTLASSWHQFLNFLSGNEYHPIRICLYFTQCWLAIHGCNSTEQCVPVTGTASNRCAPCFAYTKLF